MVSMSSWTDPFFAGNHLEFHLPKVLRTMLDSCASCRCHFLENMVPILIGFGELGRVRRTEFR